MKRSPLLGLAVIVLCPILAHAQGTQGFANISFGVQNPATKDFTQNAEAPLREETASFEATYKLKSGSAFDLSGGVLFRSTFGVSIGFTRYSKDGTGEATVVLPHPFFFDEPASDTADTDAVEHTETAVHIDAVFAPRFNNKSLQVMLFAGPSRVKVTQRLVNDVQIRETLSPDLDYAIDITDFRYETDEPSAWGFNVGGDVAYMFTSNVGVGGMIRFVRATVDLHDAIESTVQDSGVTQSFKAGGVVAAFGLRVKFGK